MVLHWVLPVCCMKEWPFSYYGAAGDLERARCPYWSLPTASGGNLLINSKSVGRSAVLEALASAGGGLLSTPGIQGPAKPQGLWLTSGLIGFSIQRRDDRPGRAQVHTVPLRVMRDSSFSYCFIMPAPGMPTGEPPPPGCTRPLGPPGLSSQRCPRAPTQQATCHSFHVWSARLCQAWHNRSLKSTYGCRRDGGMRSGRLSTCSPFPGGAGEHCLLDPYCSRQVVVGCLGLALRAPCWALGTWPSG